LFLNKKRWTMDKVLKQDFSKQSFFKYFLWNEINWNRIFSAALAALFRHGPGAVRVSWKSFTPSSISLFAPYRSITRYCKSKTNSDKSWTASHIGPKSDREFVVVIFSVIFHMCISLLCPALNHSLFLENDSLRPHSYSKQLKLAGNLDVSHRVLKIRPIFNSSMSSKFRKFSVLLQF
jgi:hypothetical protein